VKLTENDQEKSWLARLIQPHESFTESTKQFSKTDVYLSYVLAVATFAIIWAVAVATPALAEGAGYVTQTLASLSQIILPIALVFLFCKLRGQTILRHSFNKQLAVKSLAVGFILGVVHSALLILPMRPHVIGVREDAPTYALILMGILLVFTAFHEEFIRAYITPRFMGVFKSKAWGVILAGVIFSFMHVFARGMRSPDATVLTISIGSLLGDIALHALYMWLYAKYNNVFGPTLYHFMINFMGWMFWIW
jgi:membrane protease YdiL (CAAX protease family)